MSMYEQHLPRKLIRALVADDDPVMRSLIVANLEGRVDSVTEVEDGSEAWSLLLDRTFELALIDLSMPNIDGFTLVRCMRGHPRTRHLPIVVITASSDKASIERAFQEGATSFLTKPINWSLFGPHIDYLNRLAQAGDLARATMLRAEAIARAKDAVISALVARIRNHTEHIIDAAREGLHPSDDLSPEAISKSVLGDAIAITDIFDRTLPHLRGVTEQIVIGDQPVLLERLINRGMKHVAELATKRRVWIEVGRFQRQTIVRCDEGAMARALGSLLQNAVEHSESGGTVAIGVDQREDNVLAVAITDTGLGADPAYIARCLRPLDQLARGDSIAPSHIGLGLPMSHAIAQAHGGTLEISTQPGYGTTAVLVLPAEIVEIRDELVA